MKPLNLKLSAFGPYKDEINIDFKKLGNNGIFLITGDTGAGKTTIFDAISFALFGEVSGSNRQVSSLRSDFANDETETYVELEFLHKNKNYKIKRTPAYERAKKRGEGLTKINADCFLELENTVISGTKNVDSKIEEILGINAKQFKQIAMLAQGEFLKILFAESKDRTEVFRRIFDTDIYNQISKKLMDKTRVAKAELEQLKDFFAINASNIIWSSKNLENLNNKEIDNKDFEDLTKKRITEKNLEYEEINSENSEEKYDDETNKENDNIHKISPKEVNESLIEDVIEKLQKEIEINKTEFKKYNEKIKILEKEIGRLTEEIRKKQEQNNQIDIYNKLEIQKKELEEKKEEIKDKEEKVKKNQEILSKILPIEKRVKEINAEIKEKQDLLQSLKEKISEGEEKEKKSKSTVESIDKLRVLLQNYNELIEKKNEFGIIIKKIDDIIKEIENEHKAKEKCQKLEVDLEKITRELITKEIEFYREQAGILAENLKENEPCPVCGSKSHPCLAKKSENVLTKEQLDDLRKVEEKSNKVFTEAVNKVTEIDAKIETLKVGLKLDLIKYKEDIKKFSKSIEQKEFINKNLDIKNGNIELKNEEINDYKKIIEDKISKIDEDINKIYEDINEIYKQFYNKKFNIAKFDFDVFKNEITSKIQKEREQLLKDKTQLEENEKQFNLLEKKQKQEQKEYNKVLKQLGFESEETYKNLVLDEKQLNKIKKEIDQYQKDLTINNTRIEEIKKKVKDFNKIDLTEQNRELAEKQDILKDARKILMEQNTNLSNNEKILKDLIKNSINLKSKIKEYTLLDDLSRTANGTIYGKRRIEFEQFVQASYFELVILEANKRLAKMTDNRFVLVRKENSDKVYDKIGLELEVIDNYSGKKRDVKSLSGGEAFKATLSLSLGLSDVIQSYSGGIVVDTMFIDEGFGSLDDESRDQAINTLLQLTDTNKLIGIISHVTELKECIDKKIIVTKSQQGSSIKVEI